MKTLGIAIVANERLEEMVKWARLSGFTNCQLQIWDMGLLSPEEAEKIHLLMKQHSMEVTGLWCGWHGPVSWDFKEGPSVLGLVPAEYRASRTKNLLDGAEFARKLEIKDIITHVGFVPLNCKDPLYTGLVSTLRYITGELGKYGQNFLMETGQEPPVVLRRLMEDVGAENLFINFDPANLMMYGSANPVDALEMLGDKVRSVHAKDGSYPTTGDKLGLEYPIGKGQVDFKALIDRLLNMDYQGPISVEYEIDEWNPKQLKDILEGKMYLEQLIKNSN